MPWRSTKSKSLQPCRTTRIAFLLKPCVSSVGSRSRFRRDKITPECERPARYLESIRDQRPATFLRKWSLNNTSTLLSHDSPWGTTARFREGIGSRPPASGWPDRSHSARSPVHGRCCQEAAKTRLRSGRQAFHPGRVRYIPARTCLRN